MLILLGSLWGFVTFSREISFNELRMEYTEWKHYSRVAYRELFAKYSMKYLLLSVLCFITLISMLITTFFLVPIINSYDTTYY